MSRIGTRTLALASGLVLMLNLPASAVGVSGAQTLSSDAQKQLLPSPEDIEFNSDVDAYFNFRFKAEPGWATSVGIHDYDCELEDFSLSALTRKTQTDQDWLEKFEKIDESKLSKMNKLDRALLLSEIKGR